jgi:hypothetical protein
MNGYCKIEHGASDSDVGMPCSYRLDFQSSMRLVFLFASLLRPTASRAETVPVRYPEGVSHGYLVLRTLEGKPIADGDSTQVAGSDRVTSRMRFRFKDGSIYEETTVFSQHGTFRLLSDHVLQKGPTFQKPMETAIDATSGQVTVRYTEDGKEKVVSERLELPPDVANGILFTLLKNLQRNTPMTTVSYVATSPKPRLIHLEIAPQGQEPFSSGIYKHRAVHYIVKVKIGGVAGVVAPLVGKQPPDTHAWILGDDAPAFVKSEGPLYGDGPVWRMELAVPTIWPQSKAPIRSQK